MTTAATSPPPGSFESEVFDGFTNSLDAVVFDDAERLIDTLHSTKERGPRWLK